MDTNNKFRVKPVNTLEGINHSFFYHELRTLRPKKELFEEKEVELIQFYADRPENALGHIKELGFVSCPSNYLLGLLQQYPDILDTHEVVLSLDDSDHMYCLTDEGSEYCVFYLEKEVRYKDPRFTVLHAFILDNYFHDIFKNKMYYFAVMKA